jgi:hypothetical protein
MKSQASTSVVLRHSKNMQVTRLMIQIGILIETLVVSNDSHWKGMYPRDTDIQNTLQLYFGRFWKRFTKNHVTVGSSSSAISASLQSIMGFLAYAVTVVDSNNVVHLVIVDPGNGKVVSNQQLPTGMISPSIGLIR